MKNKVFLIFVTVVGLLLLALFSGCGQGDPVKNGIHIAAVFPMSGKDAPTGRTIIQGIQLYLDEVNKNRGINGHKIILDVYDDRNDKNLAREKALEIINENKAVAVIGHHYSSCSISAGEVYLKHRIPAVSPVSTNIKVTQDNDWYFRIVFNDKLQGRFQANYVSKILREKTVSIIKEDLTYGSYLADIFMDTSKDLGIEIKNIWEFKTTDKNLNDSLEKIVTDLKSKQDESGLIYFATHAPEGAQLIKIMKDKGVKNPILCPDSFASKTFPQFFDKYQEEQLTPGYYSNGIYVTCPLIFDDTDEKIQHFSEQYASNYKEEPGWRSAFAYDAAKLVLHAIKQTGIQGKRESLKEDRKKIRDFLASLTSINEAVLGVTGYNYFDSSGDCPKPISIGVYKNSKIISALTQLKDVKNLNEIFEVQQAISDERILLVDDRYLYKTNVVYTGISFNEIKDINLKNLTCELDFYLWFSYNSDLDTADINFLNSSGDINIGKPVEEYIGDRIKYQRYHVKGKFRMDALSEYNIFGKYVLAIRFCHKKLHKHNLIFVSDILGMGLTEKGLYADEADKAKILSPSSGWSIYNTRFFQDNVKVKTFGNPKINTGKDDFLTNAKFNSEVTIKKNEISFRGIIPENIVNYVFGVSSFMLFIMFISRQKGYNFLVFAWFAKTIFLIFFLISGEAVMVNLLSGKVSLFIYQYINRAYDILWWLAPAYLLVNAFEVFLWIPLELRAGQKIPNMVRRFTATIIYTCSICCITAFVFDQKITSLLATSGMVAMIIGLAIQINLSNIFSGIAINIERPFRIGDWVKIGDMEGRVTDITWRTTRIIKVGGTMESIPNSVASESVIRNYYLPEKLIEIYYSVHVSQEHSPEKVKKILLEALLNTREIVQSPPPSTNFKGFTDWSAEYGMNIKMKAYDDRWAVRNAVWTNVWLSLDKAGIRHALRHPEL